MTRNVMTIRSPNRLLGSSQRLYKSAIPLSPKGAESSYSPAPDGPRRQLLQKECLQEGQGLGFGIRDWAERTRDLNRTTQPRVRHLHAATHSGARRDRLCRTLRGGRCAWRWSREAPARLAPAGSSYLSATR